MFKINIPQIAPNTKMYDAIDVNPYLLLMLEHFNFDISINKKTIEDIAIENGINTRTLTTIVNLYNGCKISKQWKFKKEDIGTFLIFLKNTHKFYLRDKFPELNELVSLFRKTGKDAEYGLINKFFKEYYNEVKEHLKYEDEIFFPYIANLIKGKSRGKYTTADFAKHHNNIEDKLLDLKNILLNYIPNKKLNTIRRNILLHIYELNYDLYIHTYIEDKILVPLAKGLERKSV